MPYFLDLDFYLQTSSAKSAIINNAVLPVPTHLQSWKDRFKVPNVFLTQQEMHLSEEEITLCNIRDIAHALLQDVPPQVEVFESDVPNSFEEEVIPSSYPDSDSSLLFYINPEVMKNSLGEGTNFGGTQGSKPTNLETFSRNDNMKGNQELEVPILGNSFGQALSKLLVHKTTLKRLQAFFVNDPLLKPDKTPWTEMDFFNSSHQKQPFEAPSFDKAPVEEFRKCAVNEVCMDDLLMPMVKSKDKQHFVGDLHDLRAIREKLNCQQQNCFSIDDIPNVDIDCLNNTGDAQFELLGNFDLSALLAENINPPHDFNKEGTPQFNPCDDQGIDRNKSPMFGFPTISCPERPESVLNYFYDGIWREKLDPFKEQHFLGEFSFLTKKEYKKLKVDLWESERHYEEERLLEPTLPKPLLPDLFGRARELFPLNPEMESLPYNKDKAWHQYLTGMEDPSKEIALIELETKMQKPSPVEIFLKTSVPFVDNHSVSPQNHQEEDESQQETDCIFDVNNPLESFMQFRSHSTQSTSDQKVKALPKVAIKEDFCELAKIDITATFSNDAPAQESNTSCAEKLDIVKVSFAGVHEEALRCLVDFVIPHFDKLKQKGLIPHHQSFYATSVDSIRFMMNENIVQNQVSQNMDPSKRSSETSDLTQSLIITLRVRQTLHLLVHSCLPSAIHHIASFNNTLREIGPTHSLQERLLQFQHSFQQQTVLHPKFDTLLSHLRKEDQHKTKILILVQPGLMSLVTVLERILTERTSLSVNFVKNLEDVNAENLQTSGVVLSFEFEPSVQKASLESFDHVIQFDASKSTHIKELCKEMGKSFLGLVSDFNPSSGDISTVSTEKPCSKRKSPITVIGSMEMMQHQQVVYMLEARHSVMFIERNYTSVQFSQPLHHADIIFSLEVSMILLPLLEMSTHDWNLEEFIKRAIAVGLQSQQCFILVHGIGVSSKYPLDKVVLQYLYRLRSSLSNLSRSSASFAAQYKVLITMTQEDVALNVNAIAEYSVSKFSCGEEDRQFLRADMTQEEAFLLQLVCLNSFSAQLLLSKLKLEEILTMSPKQIKESFPDFPDAVLMYFHHITAKLKSDQMSSSSNSSQVSTRSTSQKSACSSSSNPTSELVNMPLSPLPSHSHSREVVPSQLAHDVTKSANVIYKQHGEPYSYPKQETFDSAVDPVQIRDNRNDSAPRTSNANVISHISNAPSSIRRNKNRIITHVSSQENEEFRSDGQRKRASSLDCRENSHPNKRVHDRYDPVLIDRYLTKGERATRSQLENVDPYLTKGERATRSQLENVDPYLTKGERATRSQLENVDPYLTKGERATRSQLENVDPYLTKGERATRSQLENVDPYLTKGERATRSQLENVDPYLTKGERATRSQLENADPYRTKGERATSTRTQLENVDHITERSVSADIHRHMMRGQRPERFEVQNGNISDVTGICYDAESSHHVENGLKQELEMVNGNNNNAENRNQYFVKRVDSIGSNCNQEISGLPIPSIQMQGTVESLQQRKHNMEDEDDSQEIFFLGKSQNSPQRTSRSVNCNNDDNSDEDDHENSIIIVKSQEVHHLHNNAELHSDAHRTLPGPDIGGLLLSDQNYNDYSDSSSTLPRSFQHPLSLSTVKPLSVSENLMKRLNPPSNSNRPSPSPQSQSNAHNSTRYGVFSAKVSRKVKPMPAPERSIDSSLTINNTTQNEFADQDFTTKNVHTKPTDLPDVTQLPFSVSWDLRKHIKQTNSNVLGINNRSFDIGIAGGGISGERISRVPSVLRDKGMAQKRECFVQNALHSTSSSSDNRDFIGEKFISHEDNLNEFGQDPSSIHRYNTSVGKITKESGHQNDIISDISGGYYHSNSRRNLSSITLFNRSSHPGKENRYVTSLNSDGVFNEQDNHHSKGRNSMSHIGLPSRSPLTNHQSMFDENMTTSQNSSSSRNLTKFYFSHEIEDIPKQKHVFPVQSQYMCNQSDTSVIQDMCSSKRRGDVVRRNEFMNQQHVNYDQSQIHKTGRDNRQYYEPQREDSYHQPKQEIHTQENARDLNSRNSADMIKTDSSSILLQKTKSKPNYNNNNNNNDNNNSLDDRYRDNSSNNLNVIHSDIHTSTSHGNMEIYNNNNNRTRHTRSHADSCTQDDRLSSHQQKRDRGMRTMTDYTDRGQERLPPPQPLPTNAMRLYNLPYTPRRTISVGLAQPVQRSQENVRSLSSINDNVLFPQPASQYHSSTHHHHHRQQPPPPPSSSRTSPSYTMTEPSISMPFSSSSPPMDLVRQSPDNQHPSQAFDAYSANKMKKWNSHLQRHAAQRFDCNYSRDQFAGRGESPPKQKRLCMKKGDGKKGQMVLVFK